MVATIFSVPLLQIRYSKFHAARVCFFAQFIFISLFLPFAIGEDARTEWVIVLAPVLACLLFGHENHFFRLSLGLIGYGIVQMIYHFHEPWMVSTFPQVYRFVLAMIISTFLYWLIVLFKRETLRSDEIIRRQHLDLLEQQETLARQNTELLEANRALDQKRLALQSLNIELQHFTSVASHDMKEPLRNISNFATLLSRRIENPEHREFLVFIEGGAKRMTRLLEDLINYARAGVENARLETVDLNDVLRTAQLNLRLQIFQTEAKIEADFLPKITGHATLLGQLFQNLIGNSLKYRRDAVAPLVEIRFFEKENHFQIEFRDNGIGIAPENLVKVFEPFRRLHAHTEIEGSGIGLATCRKIAELYEGRIWAESEVGAGTTVVLELPAALLVGSIAPAVAGLEQVAVE